MARITVSYLRELENMVHRQEISYGRMVELLNEKAAEPIRRAKLEFRFGYGYLTFTPERTNATVTVRVITSGSRDAANAWMWNGSESEPTLMPSVRTQYVNEQGENVVIHYWLKDGVCECLSDCTDGNAGKKIPLQEL